MVGGTRDSIIIISKFGVSPEFKLSLPGLMDFV
jgi:hypothetical protein